MERIATFKDYVGELKVTYKRTSLPIVKASNSKVCSDFIRPYFDECMDNHEEVKIIHLNRSNGVVNVHELSKGGMHSSIVDIRLILREALQISCVGVVLVHNHPSGNLKASQIDKEITQKLKKACELVDIALLDHIIITREGYLSFADTGLL